MEKPTVKFPDEAPIMEEREGKLVKEEQVIPIPFSSVSDVTFHDIGGLNPIKRMFMNHIICPIKHPETYQKFGISLEATYGGFLLFGPKGCGKTLVATAVANLAGANFIHLEGSFLSGTEFQPEIGEIFARARANTPCLLFFDQVDAPAKRCGKEGGEALESVWSQLLIEYGKADNRHGVYVIAATNSLDLRKNIDVAILGWRKWKILDVMIPDLEERVAIMSVITRKKRINFQFDFDIMAQSCDGVSSAELELVVDRYCEGLKHLGFIK